MFMNSLLKNSLTFTFNPLRINVLRNLKYIPQCKLSYLSILLRADPCSYYIIANNRLISRSTNTIKGIQENFSLLDNSRINKRKTLKENGPRDQTFYDVTAYSTAEEYELEQINRLLRTSSSQSKYEFPPLPEDALDVLHIQLKRDDKVDVTKNAFFFREGCSVFWNLTEKERKEALTFLEANQIGSYDLKLIQEQHENIEFTFSDLKTSLINGDINLQKDTQKLELHLEMFAFSHAISTSVKLAIWEASLEKYVSSIETVLEQLKNGVKIKLSEGEVLKKTGELFTLSHLINLSSDLLDTPDFYWDRSSLEKIYQKTCLFLNIPRRTKVMNEKLKQCVEFTELLRDHLKDKHHTRLEWMIIILIFIEVIFGCFHFWDFLSDKKKGTKTHTGLEIP